MALIIVAHPNFETSLANKTILDELQNSNLNIEVRNIQNLYPNYKIDIRAEQEALLRHQTVVFQCPFYWLNIPAILKHWFDTVFEYQFAYGSKGDKLKNKNFVLSITVGASEKEYRLTGKHHRSIYEFVKNVEQTAYYAQMNYIEPILCYGTSLAAGYTESDIKNNAKQHAEKLITRMTEFERCNLVKQ